MSRNDVQEKLSGESATGTPDEAPDGETADVSVRSSTDPDSVANVGRSVGGLARRVAIALITLIATAAVVAGIVLEAGHQLDVRDRERDDRVLGFATEAAAALVSTDKEDPNGYIDRVLGQATGDWQEEFAARRRAVADTMGASAGSVIGRGSAAGIERRNDDGTFTVLVAVSAEPADRSAQEPPSDQAPPQQVSPVPSGDAGPQQYRLRVDVAEVNGQYKLSKVGFAQ